MFTRSSQFYDALYRFKDYDAASEELHRIVRQHTSQARTLLDLTCGTGKHIERLQTYYQCEGLDLNPELLDIARERCPGIPFHLGDIINFDLGRRFDVVTCLFSSIGYVKTLENLERTVSNMAHHLNPRGIAVIEPWFSPDTYWTGTITANFVDEPDLKIAWMYTSEVEGNVSIMDIHYLAGTPQGVEHFTERHEVGLFTSDEYLKAFRKVNLEVHYDAKGLFGRGMYLGMNNEIMPQGSSGD